jgi:N-acetylglucosamine malate deacetylase 1
MAHSQYSSRMPVDLVVFGPHPDDLELGLGGVIARHTAAGHRVGLCDLTAGEMGSNGTPEERRREADASAAVLGAAWRENLGWPDGGIQPEDGLVRSAVELIRRHRPRTIAVPYWDDRHPDHRSASETLTQAWFKSGLRRYATGDAPWRPDWIVYYFINASVAPSFVIDVSAHYARKRAALDCFRTQFAPEGPDAVATRLSVPAFRQLIESRDAQFGAQIGVAFAEGVVVRDLVQRSTLFMNEASG